MREMKLRYVLELVSNIAEVAKRDAAALAMAQQRISQGAGQTSGQTRGLEQALQRVGAVSLSPASQAQAALAQRTLQAQRAAASATQALGAMGRVSQAGAVSQQQVLGQSLRMNWQQAGQAGRGLLGINTTPQAAQQAAQAVLAQRLNTTRAAATSTTQALGALALAGRTAAEQQQQTQERTVAALNRVERANAARELLGIRSEQRIRREITQTEAAYNRLMRSGSLSMESQARATEAMRTRVARLNAELRGTAEQQTRLQRGWAGAMGRGAITGAAGVAAAGMVLKAPAQQAMSYDRRLAGMANTAFADQGVAARVAGMKQLEAAVNVARKQGGGTREDAAEALDSIIASGTVPVTDAIKMLPGIMQASTASGASATELANIGVRAMQSFKIAAGDLPQVLTAAMQGGQAGGFELKDMSRWLPQQMAMAHNLGMSGKEDFARLAAWNQSAVITAGTKDEAGNNLKDLLNELNGTHFKGFLAQQLFNDGDRLGNGERNDKIKQVDQMYLDYQAKGVNKVDATLEVVSQLIQKDKAYQALQAQLKPLQDRLAATPLDDKVGQTRIKDEQRQIYEAMSAQMQGTAIGKIFHNQQSLGAFLALMNNRDYTAEVLGKVRGEYALTPDQSAIGLASGVITQTADYKVQQAGEDSKMATKEAMDTLTPTIGKVAEGFSALVDKNPALVGSLGLATASVTAFSTAVGLSTLLLSRGLAAQGAATAAGAATAGGAAAAAGAGGLAGRALAVVNPVAKVAAAGAAGYGVGSWLHEKLSGGDWGKTGMAINDGIGATVATLMSPFSRDARDAMAKNRAYNEAERRETAPPPRLPALPAARPITLRQPVPPQAAAPVSYAQPRAPVMVVRPPLMQPRVPAWSPAAWQSGPPKPPPYLQLTQPRAMPQDVGFGKGGEIKVGNGRIDVAVTVRDEMTRATTTVVQQPSLLKINGGGTNPGMYRGMR